MRNRKKHLSLVGATVLLVTGVLFSSAAIAQVLVTPIPANPTPLQGDTLCIQVVVVEVSNLYAANFNLTYNPAVLDYQGTTEGSFLNQDGRDTAMQAAALGGQIVVAISRLSDASGVTGSGTLATPCFEVIGDYHFTDDITFGNTYLEEPVQDGVIDLAGMILESPKKQKLFSAYGRNEANFSY